MVWSSIDYNIRSSHVLGACILNFCRVLSFSFELYAGSVLNVLTITYSIFMSWFICLRHVFVWRWQLDLYSHVKCIWFFWLSGSWSINSGDLYCLFFCILTGYQDLICTTFMLPCLANGSGVNGYSRSDYRLSRLKRAYFLWKNLLTDYLWIVED